MHARSSTAGAHAGRRSGPAVEAVGVEEGRWDEGGSNCFLVSKLKSDIRASRRIADAITIVDVMLGLREPLPDDVIESLLHGEPALVYKDDARSRVVRVDVPAGSFVIKRYVYAPWRQFMAWKIGSHPIQREQLAISLLDEQGFRVLPMLASGVLSTKRGFIGYGISRFVGESLHRRIRRKLFDSDDQQRLALESAGEQTARLIEQGIYHRDLKASNLLIDDEGHAWLIDVGDIRGTRSQAKFNSMLQGMDTTFDLCEAKEMDRARFRKAAGIDRL